MSTRDEMAAVIRAVVPTDRAGKIADALVAAGYGKADNADKVRAEAWDEGHLLGVIDAMHQMEMTDPSERLLFAVEVFGRGTNPYEPSS